MATQFIKTKLTYGVEACVISALSLLFFESAIAGPKEPLYIECVGWVEWGTSSILDEKVVKRYEGPKFQKQLTFKIFPVGVGWEVAEFEGFYSKGWRDEKVKLGEFEREATVRVTEGGVYVKKIETWPMGRGPYGHGEPLETVHEELEINRTTGKILSTTIYQQRAQVYAEAYEVNNNRFEGLCKKTTPKF